mgnify:CR=1 FL=1
MHSRIFQLSEKRIPESEYMQLSFYYDHWFTNEIADWIDESDRNDDIEWLKSVYSDGVVYGEDDNGQYLIVESKKKIFAPKFEEFKRFLGKLQNVSLEDFSKSVDGCGDDVFYLCDAYEDKLSFYVALKGDYDVTETITFDYFIRRCRTNTKYYIGNTIDYHY